MWTDDPQPVEKPKGLENVIPIQVNIGRESDGPIFKGDDAEGWIQAIERHFKIHKFLDEERLDQVISYLESSSLQWYI